MRDAIVVGVRSFLHPIDSLDERRLEMIDLVPFFDGRYIKSGRLAGSNSPEDLRPVLLARPEQPTTSPDPRRACLHRFCWAQYST